MSYSGSLVDDAVPVLLRFRVNGLALLLEATDGMTATGCLI
jgi:hypothetical protein